ncbi:hypothetical protein XA67_16280 [Comamonas thiooxydans]|nr:hypothetical protein XA67_16280 [Comamonas thiooxydans]
MVAHIRFSKVISLLLLIGATYPSMASDLKAADVEMMQRGKDKAISGASLLDLSTLQNKHMSAADSDARQFYEQLKEQGRIQMSTPGQSSAPGQQPKDQTDSYTSLVFASFSLGDAAMKELMDDVAGRRDTVIVLRGVAPGESLAKGIARVQSMAASRKVMPSIIINPTLFQEFNVNAVPTVVLLNKPDISKNYKVKSKVSGIGSVDWLKRKFSENNKVDQGNYGPTRDISEPDIIEVAKARLASIDWDEKKRNAIKNFWKNQKFLPLPTANEDVRRTIDPTVIVARDISSADGKVIVRSGTSINPLSLRSFTQAVIVFNPNDPWQNRFVKVKARELLKQKNVSSISYIATEINIEDGWKSYKNITESLGAPIFLLTPDVRNRFDLRVTPSVITATDRNFEVAEFKKVETQ